MSSLSRAEAREERWNEAIPIYSCGLNLKIGIASPHHAPGPSARNDGAL